MAIECPKCQTENHDNAKYCRECATPLTSAEEISPTGTLEMPIEMLQSGILFANRYRIIEQVGKGGMGRVYKVRDTQIDEDIALKLIKPEISTDEKVIERFRNELIIARKITHKNVCRLFDINEEAGTPFITMEYVTGKDLKSILIKEDRLTEERIISIAKQVCEGLEAAHDLNVVHRDLKPQNIMINEEGKAKIMDFGIARSIKTPGVTQEGTTIGTPEYMSPEQVEGKETDQRSDIYSFGVILYEMITGRVPFEGDTPLSIAYKHKHESPLDPRKLNDQISARISEMALKCLQKDKKKRYLTASKILDELIVDLSSFKSLDVRPSNLPIQPTSLIGRERDLENVRKLLSQPDVRMLTLTGPGGIGKTRLGLQLAASLSEEFEDGVYFVPLAPISDPMLVISTVAQTLGVHDRTSQSIFETLQEFLSPLKILLFLDSFEHVCEAASEVAQLLETCRHVKFLITSRQPLHVRGEHEFLVHPLISPGVSQRLTKDELEKIPSVELFIQRAQSVKSSFSLTDENAPSVAEICTRLDGLPLAIELAAARVKLFPPKLLLQRLIEADGPASLQLLSHGPRDVPERHRTLQAAMDWSFNLLDDDEQNLLQTLSVFAGGFTFAAAEAVCCEGLNGDVMDGLSSLLDKSLLQQEEISEDESRFTMLGLIREYAGQKLQVSGRDASIKSRHAHFFLDLAEKSQPKLEGPDQGLWLERLEVEHNNLRSALGWFLQQSEAGSNNISEASISGLRLAGALWQFWDTHGYVSEGRRWLEKMISLNEEHSKELVDALIGAASLASRQSDMTEALRWYEQAVKIGREIGYKAGIAKALGGMVYAKEFLGADEEMVSALYSESLELWREVGDKRGIAMALGPMARRAVAAYNFVEANKLYEESLSLFREVQDKREIAGALWNLAQIDVALGQYDEAKKNYSESLKLYEGLKDLHGVATQLRGLGDVERYQGYAEQARSLYEKSLESFRSMGDKGCGSIALAGLARVALDMDDISGASSLIQECLSLSREISFKAAEAVALRLYGQCHLSQGNHGSARRHFFESLDLEQELDHREGIILNLEGIASTAAAESASEKAARLFSATESLRRQLGIPLAQVDVKSQEKWKKILRDKLGNRDYDSAKAEGSAFTIDQAIDLAKKEDL
jgi:predicted ATPase